MTVDGKDYGTWMKASMDMWMLGAEASTVRALRMARIATGGAAGAAEGRTSISAQFGGRDEQRGIE